MKQESVTEAYLRRATRGLWGRRRREVREELEAHLRERVMAHRIAGLREADAVERALAELGSPQEVSVGMTRLYTLPTVMGSGAALAAACVLVVALLPKGAAQSPVTGTFYWPSAECTAALRSDSILRPYQTCEVLDNSLWLDPQALTRTLEAQGVTVRRGDETLTLTFPGATPVQIPSGDANVSTVDMNRAKVPAAPGSLSLWTILREVSAQTDLPIRIEGYDNPVVTIEDVSFQVGTELRPITGSNFYSNYLENVFISSLMDELFKDDGVINISIRASEQVRPVELELMAAKPGVYGVATISNRDLRSDPDLHISLEVARINGGERLAVNLPEGPVHFVESFGSEAEEGTSVLVRLAGSSKAGGWYKVISPERITVR